MNLPLSLNEQKYDTVGTEPNHFLEEKIIINTLRLS
jgi:hypothetical protein